MLRLIPNFKGKHRVGKFFEKVLLLKGYWKQPPETIRMKSGLLMRIDPNSDTHSGAFWTGRYDDQIIKKIICLFDCDWVVLDIGANIGYYSTVFAKKLKTINGVLYSFEPVRQNQITLLHNLKLNKVEDVVFVYPVALGNESGEIDINITEKGETSNAYIVKGDFKTEESTRSETVRIETLDSFAEKNNIRRCDFIKVDIEGAEIFFVQGATKFLGKYKPIIYGEFNNYFLGRFGYTFLDVWNILNGLGYSCYQQISEKGYFSPVVPGVGLENVLLVPKECIEKTKISQLIRK